MDVGKNWKNICRKNIPVYHRLLQAMGMEDAGLTCGAVCVYPNRVAECVEALKRSNPKRRVRNWKHRFDPGTRRKTSQWLQWRLAFQVAKCLLPPGFRWLKLLQLDFVHHLFLSALFFWLKLHWHAGDQNGCGRRSKGDRHCHQQVFVLSAVR